MDPIRDVVPNPALPGVARLPRRTRDTNFKLQARSQAFIG
jgi:hypothetical protein